MIPEEEDRVRRELERRRGALENLVADRQDESLVDLLRRVDVALERVDRAEWGLCTVCHEPIEQDLAVQDALIQVCLGCLTPEARRALEDDLQGAARMQRGMLPRVDPGRDGWEVAWLWEPLGVVSGDHLDIVAPRSDGEPMQVLFGDVAGKGITASLLQSHLHALARALMAEPRPLGRIVEQINHLFCAATAAASYATLIALRLHPDGRMEMVNAGHPRALLGDARGVRPIEGAGLPVGLFCEARYETREIELSGGDVVFLYTDGWTEAVRDGEEFGIGRAASTLRKCRGDTVQGIVGRCREAMEEFLERGTRTDDLTLLAIRRGGG